MAKSKKARKAASSLGQLDFKNVFSAVGVLLSVAIIIFIIWTFGQKGF